MCDMAGKRITGAVIVLVLALTVIDDSAHNHVDDNPLPQLGIDALHRFATDRTANLATLRDFAVAYDGNVGALMHLTVCVRVNDTGADWPDAAPPTPCVWYVKVRGAGSHTHFKFYQWLCSSLPSVVVLLLRVLLLMPVMEVVLVSVLTRMLCHCDRSLSSSDIYNALIAHGGGQHWLLDDALPTALQSLRDSEIAVYVPRACLNSDSESTTCGTVAYVSLLEQRQFEARMTLARTAVIITALVLGIVVVTADTERTVRNLADILGSTCSSCFPAKYSSCDPQWKLNHECC